MKENNNEKKNDGIDEVMIILSYLGCLCLVPFLTKKEDAYIMKHATHGLDLFICVAIGWIACSLFNLIGLHFVATILNSLIGLCYLVIIILSILKGLKGEDAPLMGKFKIVERFINK